MNIAAHDTPWCNNLHSCLVILHGCGSSSHMLCILAGFHCRYRYVVANPTAWCVRVKVHYTDVVANPNSWCIPKYLRFAFLSKLHLMGMIAQPTFLCVSVKLHFKAKFPVFISSQQCWQLQPTMLPTCNHPSLFWAVPYISSHWLPSFSLYYVTVFRL